MIFVSTGSYEPFDRLLQAIGELPGDEEVLVQCGRSTVRPLRARCVEFLPFAELVREMQRARVVVTHAGVGSVLVALRSGKRAVVVPRLRRFHEAVDDHQLEFARRMQEVGAVMLVEDVRGLPAALEHAAASPLRSTGGPLAAELREYIAGEVARAAVPALEAR